MVPENQRNYQNADINTNVYNNNNNNGVPNHDIDALLERASLRTRTMNAVILSSVFFLGAVSAVFLTVFWTFDGRGGGERRATFQPLPHIVDLQVIDEEFMDPLMSFNSNPFQEEDNECDSDNPLGFELEAISSLHLAMEMKEMGKLGKAQKLFKHAMALCPRHPDILTNYGEFYEKSQDYMMADHLYVQALTYAPHHTKALANRKRTLPVVEELDERRLKIIDGKREQLLQLPQSSYALRRVRKEAYFQHIYHSAGIEGNTMTLSQTRQVLETRIAVGGKSIVEHNEILGLDAALRFINMSLVNRIGRISVDDILSIHKHLMGFVDPEEAGKFRRTQVYVGNHVPPRPKDIASQMDQLIEWLNSEEALSLHPIHYAAIAHYKLVYVHPFLDGNGRTSRLLMNWILMQADYPAVIIRKQDRQLYYDHLNAANKGDVRPFIRFIADCTEKTVDVYLWATREHFYQILELEEELKAIEQQKQEEEQTQKPELKREESLQQKAPEPPGPFTEDEVMKEKSANDAEQVAPGA
ncbi:Adenosine monophosphate-protein transferase FICD [Orchesella cincta]|uniref:Protein adenylyltransferase Fic n=1 Tax=Orchesella cincta TaxID=48709 RepID=A0A1D2NIK4_ORCCI|nr:Adenosine monophosphate-protein transferase FICD [Orchesella cincta]